ncbi:MAG: chemotaxis response regulator protein-glutamate methylesterase [Thermodesulfobacteriota bacterium]
MPAQIRVLIADDSALMRRVLREILETDPRVEVVGAARDGVDLLDKAARLKPDVITLDINMPNMDGLTALGHLVRDGLGQVVMVSSLTQAGAEATLKALEMGAFDCVAKPGGTVSANLTVVSDELLRKVRAAASAGTVVRLARPRKRPGLAAEPVRPAAPVPQRSRPAPSVPPVGHKAVAIGISTGGPKTILDVLPALPADLPAAVFMVQHLPPSFTASYAERLDRCCRMRCLEAQSGMVVQPGTIYLGQGGRHLTVARRTTGEVVIRTPSRPEHAFMPSVDVMMESILGVYGQDTVGVLMTGMGDDGAKAMAAIHQAAGVTIAESEESAVVWGMPGAAVALNAVQLLAGSWEMAREIIKAVQGR